MDRPNMGSLISSGRKKNVINIPHGPRIDSARLATAWLCPVVCALSRIPFLLIGNNSEMRGIKSLEQNSASVGAERQLQVLPPEGKPTPWRIATITMDVFRFAMSTRFGCASVTSLARRLTFRRAERYATLD
jgi:hypothetical protein